MSTFNKSSTLTPKASAIFGSTSQRGGFSLRSQKAMLAYPIEIYLNDDSDWNYYKSVVDSVEQ